MAKNTSLEQALAKMRLEFIDDTLERLTTLDDLLFKLRSHDDEFDAAFQDLQRHVHSIKGLAGTFDFQSITQIANRLEDHIEISPQIGDRELDVIEVYLDRIGMILQAGENPPEQEMESYLRAGILSAEEIAKAQDVRVVDILLVMPQGVQRKLIAEELASCGFRLSMVDSPVEAIGRAIEIRPDIVFATLEMVQMSGTELARALEVISATQGSRFILLTSQDAESMAAKQLPANTAIIKKGANFFEDLMGTLVEWGMFGNVAKSA